MATPFYALLENLGIHSSPEMHVATIATHPFDALFERLGIEMTPETPSKEETLALLLSMFVLFNLGLRFIDNLQYLIVATIHLVIYALCSFTDFPLRVAADVLISMFFIITAFKLIFFILNHVYLGELAKWVVITAAAYSFVAGPDERGSISERAPEWVYVWHQGIGTLHKYLVTIGIGLTGIFVGVLKDDGYESPLFRKSALLFATIGAGIQAHYRQLAAGPGGHGRP